MRFLSLGFFWHAAPKADGLCLLVESLMLTLPDVRLLVLLGLGMFFLASYWGHLLVAALLTYLASGLSWYGRYYLAKPAAHRFSCPAPPVILLWPAVWFVYAHMDPRLLHHPEPYCVVYGGLVEADGSRHAVFAAYEEALDFARMVSSETGTAVAVFDLADYGKRSLPENASGVLSYVSPQGEIESICLVK